jgi:hypothetical protein
MDVLDNVRQATWGGEVHVSDISVSDRALVRSGGASSFEELPVSEPLAETSKSAADEDVVIDVTDRAVAEGRAGIVEPAEQSEGDDVVIDLRELAPTGRKIAGDASTPGRSGRPRDLLPHHHLVKITGGDAWMKCEAFVYDIYVSLGYTHESSVKEVEELVRFRDRSVFFAVVDEDERVVGTTRAIYGTFDQLPVGKFTRVDFEDDGPMCELSSIVVDPSVRSIGIIEHLYREGWADATRNDCTAITGLGEKWLLDAFRDNYGMPFVPVGQPKYYMGGDVIPMILSNTPETMAEVTRCNPGYLAWNMETLTEPELERYGFASIAKRARELAASLLSRS